MKARPVADIASFPAPGWTDTPLYEKVDDVDADDSAFITGLAPGAEDPQVALQIGDTEIPYGASGRIIVRVRMRWSQDLQETADSVRIGVGDASDLNVDNPTLQFVRSVVGFSSTEFQTIEIAFDYTDFAGEGDELGVYVEMTPATTDANAGAVGHISWIEVEACVPAVIVGRCALGSLTPRDIIQHARDYSPAFESRTHPDRALLRMLSHYQREIAGRIAQSNPALIATPVVATLPLDDFDNGVELPSFVYVMPGAEVRYSSNTDVVEVVQIVNLTMRADAEMARNVLYLRGNNVYLSGRASNWDQFSELRLNVVLTPKDLQTLDDPLMLPDFAADAYVGSLVWKMAARSGIGDPLMSMAGRMESEVMASVAQQHAAQVSETRDVFGEGVW